MRLLAFALLLAACGSAPRPAPTPPPAEDLAPTSSLGGVPFPAMPPGVTADDPELTDGLAILAGSLAAPAPRPPEAREAFERWADEVLTPWITARGEALGRASRALEGARQGRSDRSVVASAALGVAFERFALDVRGLATPPDWAADLADALRRALDRLSRPLLLRARDAYGSCASTAAGAPAYSLARWRRWCDEAAARLELPVLDEPAEPSSREKTQAN